MRSRLVEQRLRVSGITYIVTDVPASAPGRQAGKHLLSTAVVEQVSRAVLLDVIRRGLASSDAAQWMRKQAGWSRRELAERVGVPVGDVERWEASGAVPPTSAWVELARQVKGVDADVIRRGLSAPRAPTGREVRLRFPAVPVVAEREPGPYG